tara:strand:+ start:820 stop:993 length:174 start_codon:yes stop_codon:yes gene_type:complete
MILLNPRSLEDVYAYEKRALDALEDDAFLYSLSEYNEIRSLLTQQIKDEINDTIITR